MSNAPHTYRRRLGRAPSPPTWLWYEQIPFDDDDDDSSSESCSGESDDDIDDDEFGSCSEDGEDYAARECAAVRGASGQGGDAHSESGASSDNNVTLPPQPNANENPAPGNEAHMEVDSAAPGSTDDQGTGGDRDRAGTKKDIKGKQRAVEPATGNNEEERTKRRERERARRKKQREPSIYSLRPILTIQKSQGFVWNQDLFVPPYIKDRYIASTSPPNGSGCLAAPASSFNAHNDYEVDVVEIRVKEGEFSDIIP